MLISMISYFQYTLLKSEIKNTIAEMTIFEGGYSMIKTW